MIRLRTLGSVELVSEDGRPIQSVLAQPKRLALLVYLAAPYPVSFRSRDNLLGLFWPESREDRARRSLNQAVHYLRRSLGAPLVVNRGEDQLGVDDRALWCDAAAFSRAVDEERWEEALELYRGNFLEDFSIQDHPDFEHWVERERAQLQSRAVEASLRLAGMAEREEQLPKALAWTRRAVEMDPDRESTIRRLIELLARSGDRAEALVVFEAHANRLRSRFGLKPSAPILELVRTIRTGAGPSASGTPEPLPPSEQAPVVAAAIAATPQIPQAQPQPSPKAARDKGAFVGLGVLAAVGLAVLAWQHFRAPPADSATESGRAAARRVILTDFRSPSGDSLLARIVTQALRVDLSQSQLVREVEPHVIQATITRMEVPDTVPLNLQLAREVAVREGIPTVLTGEVAQLGHGYLILAQAISVQTGEILAAAREQAEDSTRVIEAIDRLSAELRRELGESVSAIRSSKPLAQVTTPTLDALRKYTLAVHALDVEGNYQRGVSLLEEAISIDPGFAMAHNKLAAAWENQNEVNRALDAYERAYRNRDRLTELERLTITANYFDAIGEPKRAISVLRTLVDSYPGQRDALSNLGYLYGRVGMPAQGAHYYARALSMDSLYAKAAANLVSAAYNAGDLEWARSTLQTFLKRFPDHPRGPLQGAYLASALRNYTRAEAWARQLVARYQDETFWSSAGYHRLAEIAAVRGQLSGAEEHMREPMREELQENRLATYADDAITLAKLDLYVRKSRERAMMRVERLLNQVPVRSLRLEEHLLTDLAWLFADAGKPERSRAILKELLDETDPRLSRKAEQQSRAIRAAILLSEGRGAQALAQLRSLEPSACSICFLPHVARAHEMMGDVDAAIAAYERYLRTPYFYRLYVDAIWLPHVHERLAELYERQGSRDRAALHSRRLAELWVKADPELQPRQLAACRRLARLGARAAASSACVGPK